MDMVWDYATQLAGVSDYVLDTEGKTIAEFRARREIILSLRKRQPQLEKETAGRALRIIGSVR